MTLRTFAYAHGKGQITLQARAEGAAELLVYGLIGESFWEESVTAKAVVTALAAMNSREITVRVLSRGGSVADGVAIYNALRANGARIITRNEGEAASIAGLILMAGDEVQSFANASFMVHAPWGYVAGNATELRDAANYLDKLAAGMATSYARKTGKGDAHALALMQDGKNHFYTAEEAKAEGFVDVILDAVPAATAALETPAFAALFPDFTQPTPAAFARLAIQPFAAARGLQTEPPMPPEPSPAATANNTALEAAKAEATQAAKAAERARKDEVRSVFAMLPHRTAFAELEAQCLDDETITGLDAGKRILTAQAAAAPATPTGGPPRTEAGADERDHFRAGMVNALLHRFDPHAHKLDEPGRKFQGMNLVRMAEEACRVSGIRASMRPGELAAKALNATTDFPYVLENVISKTLRNAYEGTPRTFLPFCRKATLPDFKEVRRVNLSGAPALRRVVEGGEYQHGTIGDGAEKYAVQKYGRMIPITWEVIINDDLSAITRIPQLFGRSAADLESDIVYGVLTANAALADGIPLFHADHGNLGAGAVVGDSALSQARELMLLQKGLEGRYITVRPEFLIVPPRQLTPAQKAVALPIIPTKTADANTFYQSLNIIAEPRLQDTSANAWYLAANPNAIDTIEYGYLEGYEGVFTETKQGFEVDGVVVKCRHIFGAKAIDHRGLFRNPGA